MSDSELLNPQFGDVKPEELTAMLNEENLMARAHMRKQQIALAQRDEIIAALRAEVAALKDRLGESSPTEVVPDEKIKPMRSLKS